MTHDTTYDPSTAAPGTFTSATEIRDLGRERFDHDTAAASDRDAALYFAPGAINVAAGRAPKGFEAQAFAWKTMQFTDSDQNTKEELKGDLHGGQLHRQNRAAVRAMEPEPLRREERGGRGGRGARGGKGGMKSLNDREDGLTAAMKPPGGGDVPPLAKGYAEELDKSLFWDGKIV